MADIKEIRTLVEMISTASDHSVERYDSERIRFIERSRQLATAVVELFDELSQSHETLTLACEFLHNGTPICNGSDLHADLLVCRDLLSALKLEGGA